MSAHTNKAQWVLASSNKGKISEFNHLLAEHNVKLIAQAELGINDAEETGLSFIENAILKARHAASASGQPALADDSGLAVDALGGAPGIYSARYSQDKVATVSDQSNIDLLLENLSPHFASGQSITAAFYCVIAFVRHANDPTPIIAQGRWQGRIVEQAQGAKGFGYDPVFYLESEGCTSAELSPGRKNSLSHRAIALRSFITQYQQSL